MKKNIALFIFSIIGLSSYSQTNTYHPFPESNAEWNVSQVGSGLCKHIKYILNGADTIIQSKVYHKITKTEVSYAQLTNGMCDYNTVTAINTGYAGAIRNDSLVKKVYFVIPNVNKDTLLFDFSLNVGDTIRTYIATTCGNRKVISIDSVLVGGTYHKRLHTTECYFGGQDVEFIEGVGSNLGLIERIPSMGSYNIIGSLNCFSRNAQSLYPTNSTTNCPLINSIYNTEINNQVSIHSNEKTINVKQTSNNYTNYLIYSTTGNVISKGMIESPNITINLKDAVNGIYFISLTGKEQQIIKKVLLTD